MKRRILAIFLILSIMGGLNGCDSAKAHHYTIGDTFDTIIEVICYTSAADAKKYGAMAQQELKEYHKLFDGYHLWEGVNNICTLNENAGEWVEVDEKLSDLLYFGKEVFERTDGKVNLMGGAISLLWKNRDKPPTEDEISVALQHIDIHTLEIEQGRARITDKQARIDVGAFAKGYALQRVAEALEKQGFVGLLSAVSSVVAVGDKSGEPFAIGLAGVDGGVERTVFLKDKKALSTSGTNQRFFTYEGKTYHHIIDLATGYPAESGVRQASVLDNDAGWADALSTATLIGGTALVPDTILFESEE